MNWIGSNEGTIWGTLFRDLLTISVGMFILLLAILIFHLATSQSNSENERDRGNVRVEIMWPDEMDVDIDLWVQAPGDVPVGYSNLNGVVFNLVRDDLGHYNDLTSMNYEVAHSRGLPDTGEWTINIHWFSNRSHESRVPVTLLLTIKKNDGTKSKESPIKVINTTVTLIRVGQERTVIRFKLDGNGDVITDSISRLNKYIRESADEHP